MGYPDDLLQIIKWRDEIAEINYTITRLELAEQTAVDEDEDEIKPGEHTFERIDKPVFSKLFKSQLLKEKARLKARKKYLETKISNS